MVAAWGMLRRIEEKLMQSRNQRLRETPNRKCLGGQLDGVVVVVVVVLDKKE
jgi:hypothetical protein